MNLEPERLESATEALRRSDAWNGYNVARDVVAAYLAPDGIVVTQQFMEDVRTVLAGEAIIVWGQWADTPACSAALARLRAALEEA